MAGILSAYRRQIGLALKIETIAKIDKRAKLDNTSRNAVAEYFLASALAKVELDPDEQAAVAEEIRHNLSKRRRA